MRKMAIATVTLNDGVKIPIYGFGTFQIPNDGSTVKAVQGVPLPLASAISTPLPLYFNEQEVGRAIREKRPSQERNICDK